MARLVLGALGALSTVLPDAVLDAFETGFIANADDCDHTPYARTSVRAEGGLVLLASLIGGRPYAGMLYLTGLFGTALVVAPQLYRAIATPLLYENPDQVEWVDGYETVIRAIGALYVLGALITYRKRHKSGAESIDTEAG